MDFLQFITIHFSFLYCSKMSSSAETTSSFALQELQRAYGRVFDNDGTVLERDLRRAMSRFSPPGVDAAVPVSDVSGSLPPVRQVQEISRSEPETTTAPGAVSYLQIRDGGEEYTKYRDDAYRKHETLVKSAEKDLVDLTRLHAHNEVRLVRRKLHAMYNTTWPPAAETQTREQLDGLKGSMKSPDIVVHPIAGTLRAVAGGRAILSITFKGGPPNMKNGLQGNLRFRRVPGIFVALVAGGPCLVSNEDARYWYPADRENPAMPELVFFEDFREKRKCNSVQWVPEPDREVQLSHVLDCVQRLQPAAVGEGYWLATMEDGEQALAFDNDYRWWPIPGTKRDAVSKTVTEKTCEATEANPRTVTYLQIRFGDQSFDKYRDSEAYGVRHAIIKRMEDDLANMLQLKSERENEKDLVSPEYKCLVDRIRDKRREIETLAHYSYIEVGLDVL